MCPSGGYTIYGDSSFCFIQNTLSKTPWNSAVTHRVLQILIPAPILCHAVTSDARVFTYNHLVYRSDIYGQPYSFRFSVLHLASTKSELMLRVFFRCICFKCVLFRCVLFRCVLFRCVLFRCVLFRCVLFRCVLFRCIWLYSMCVSLSQPPILASIQCVVDRSG
jgi:hypothetical protein